MGQFGLGQNVAFGSQVFGLAPHKAVGLGQDFTAPLFRPQMIQGQIGRHGEQIGPAVAHGGIFFRPQQFDVKILGDVGGKRARAQPPPQEA